MKKSGFTVSLFCWFLVLGGTSFGQTDWTESFENAFFWKTHADGNYDYYSLKGAVATAGAVDVRVTNSIVGVPPAIKLFGPRGEREWVFATGSSTMWRDVHWRHQVDIRYFFDQPMAGAAVAFKYLNTRRCGGRVDVIFVEYGADGSVLWYAKKRCEDWERWPGPYSQLGGSVADRTWRDYLVSSEQAAALVQGRSFNCIIIREFDITSEQGTGYFDDIQITATPAGPPEPDTDGDGVIDRLDLCPDTPAEAQVDGMGCRLPDPLVGGGFIVVDDTREVTVRCAGKSGEETHTLYAIINGEETFLFESGDEGAQVSLGRLPVGTLIQFRLEDHATGSDYYSAGSEQNPDGRDHVQIISTENPFVWECGFEDSAGADAFDFEDALFFVSGVSAVTSAPELQAENDCLDPDREIAAGTQQFRIIEFPQEGKGTLLLRMHYDDDQVDLSAGDVDLRVQLIQEGQVVQLGSRKTVRKHVSNNRTGRVQRIYYKENGK